MAPEPSDSEARHPDPAQPELRTVERLLSSLSLSPGVEAERGVTLEEDAVQGTSIWLRVG